MSDVAALLWFCLGMNVLTLWLNIMTMRLNTRTAKILAKAGTSKPQGGHQPATGEGAPSGPPPNQGTSVAPRTMQPTGSPRHNGDRWVDDAR
jgi:hypothetical protein